MMVWGVVQERLLVATNRKVVDTPFMETPYIQTGHRCAAG